MKACILAPYRVLPVKDGPARRVLELSRGLTEAGVSVVLLHAGKTKVTEDGLQVVGYPAFENLPLTKNFLWSRALDAYLASWNPILGHYLIRLIQRMDVDILQIEGPMSLITSGLFQTLYSRLPIVYDAHNVESIACRFSSRIPWLWPYVNFIEREVTKHSDTILCVSKLDKAIMCNLYSVSPSKVFVIPNGVRIFRDETDSYSRIRRKLGLATDAKIILFHGLLAWRPNFEAARTIIDSIALDFQTESHQTVFLIAGAHPPTELLNRARKRPNVRVLGYVPKIEEYINAADVCIAPMMSGSGTKLKILEYLAAGKPVIATRKAVEGMEIRDGVEALLLDDTGEEFTNAIKLALTKQLPEGLEDNAKAFARLFEWSNAGQRLNKIYESITSH